MQLIEKSLSGLKLAEPINSRNLSMFPIAGEGSRQPDYLLLDQAISLRCVHVTEVSESGSVPELKFINESDRRIFLMDGEELVGAKQNRVLNLSILVPAGKTIVIPVSCVERGRWGYQSREFTSSQSAHYAEARAMRHEQVSASLKETGLRNSNQSELWEMNDLKASRMRVHSPTSAMDAMYETHTGDIEEFVRAFTAREDQVGALFAIDGKIVGFDVFDCTATLRYLLPKLARSYALDAIESSFSKNQGDPALGSPTLAEAGEFLRSVVEARAETFPAVGEGVDVRLTGPAVTAAALVAEERLVHMSAFHLVEGSDTGAGLPGSRLNRPSMRARGSGAGR
ncbi:MAG: hypothetical protein LAO31_17975 [Acidobacteriia bacterium]|nr:hypothetical protein [Terriglobia bacterium]